MLKGLDTPYPGGRSRGSWWKWKLDPYTLDAVLLYAKKGPGRRASLFTDFTFGIRDGEGFVPVARAYSGLTDAEFRKVDRWIRRHITERFGPVRAVEPGLVFELAFEGIRRSTRHRSGVAGVFPVVDADVERRHRWNIGTITDDAQLRVRFRRGTTLGSVEESFLAQLRPGDTSLFAGRRLALVEIRDLTASVRQARAGAASPRTPRWMGGRLPLSTELAGAVLETFRSWEAAGPGGRTSARQLQASSGLLFDVLTRWNPDILLLAQARTEALESEMEITQLKEGLARLARLAEESLMEVQTPRLTPLAFPLWAERVHARVSTERWIDRVTRMAATLERAAGSGRPTRGRHGAGSAP